MRENEDDDYLLPYNIEHFQDTVDCQSSKVQLIKLINSGELEYDYTLGIIYPKIVDCDSNSKYYQDYHIQNEVKP
jgi:hypothetical protein